MLKAIRLLVLLGLLFGSGYVSVMTVLHPTQETTEQRRLADLPGVPQSFLQLQDFFRGVDDWASDRLYFRQAFISLFKGLLKIRDTESLLC